MATPARHETGALLRAHLSAAVGYRHATRNCPICRQLLRLASEPAPEPGCEALEGPETPAEAADAEYRPDE